MHSNEQTNGLSAVDIELNLLLKQFAGLLQECLAYDQCILITDNDELSTPFDGELPDSYRSTVRLSVAENRSADFVLVRRERPITQEDQDVVCGLVQALGRRLERRGYDSLEDLFNQRDAIDHRMTSEGISQHYLEALLNAQKVVADQFDFATAIETIVLQFEDIIGVDAGLILLYNPEEKVLVPHVDRLSGRYIDREMWQLPLGRGVMSLAVETGTAHYLPEAHKHPRSEYLSELRALVDRLGESVMIAPLTSGDEILGVLFVNRLGSHQFSDQEFTVFQLFAAQVSIALQKAAQLDQERNNRQTAECLAHLVTQLIQVESESEIARLAVDVASSITSLDHAWVVFRDNRRHHVTTTEWFNIDHFSIAVPSADALDRTTWPFIDVEGPTIVRELSKLPDTVYGPLTQSGAKNILVLPLQAADGRVGDIWLWSEGQELSDSLAALAALETLLGQVSATLDRVRARQSASDLRRLTSVLTDVTGLVLSSDDEIEALHELASLLVSTLDARLSTIWLRTGIGDAPDAFHLCSAHVQANGAVSLDLVEPDLLNELIPLRSDWIGRFSVIPNIYTSELSVVARRQCVAIGTGALILYPLHDGSQLMGFVRIDFAHSRELPDDTMIGIGKGIVDQFGLGMNARRLRERWLTLYRSSVEALAATVDAKDPYTHTHSRNVAIYCRHLAELMNLPDEDVDQIELAGLLHDIGKISIADRILTKTGPLEQDEQMMMMTHPIRGAQILSGHDGLTPLVSYVRHHHERYDGYGYPDGLRGDEIPLGASIVSVSDAFDTMINDRSYAQRRTVEDALGELREASGTQFDPHVVDSLTRLLRQYPDLARIRETDPNQEWTGVRSDHMAATEVAQVRVISRLAQELDSLTDLDTFLQHASRIITEELEYPDVHIILLDENVLTAMRWGRARPLDAEVTRVMRESGTVFNIPDLSMYPGLSGQHSGSLLAVPLHAEGVIIGAIYIVHNRLSAFSIVDESILMVAASQLAAATRVAQLYDKHKWAARHDALTGALNHGAFYDELEQAIANYHTNGAQASLIICDVEGMKRVNDRYGHLAGDEVLKSLVRRIRDIVNRNDIIARYGGDEFAIITFDTTRNEASEVATRLRESLAIDPLVAAEESVLVTFGIAQIGEDSMSASDLVFLADELLYKARGRRHRIDEDEQH